MACRKGLRVLLTIGSKNLAPYVRAAEENQAEVYARVLLVLDSLVTCHKAGLSLKQVIGVRGLFSREDNPNLLHQLKIDVLVTKESGVAGGFKEKIEAAVERKCRVVIIQRPVESGVAECRRFDEIVDTLAPLSGRAGAQMPLPEALPSVRPDAGCPETRLPDGRCRSSLPR